MRPVLGVAVQAGGAEADEAAGGDGVVAARGGEALRDARGGGLRDADDGGQDAELLVHDGAAHAAEELGDVVVVVPFGAWAVAEDGVEVLLQAALGGRVHGEEDAGEVDCVGGGFVAGEDEDEGVAEDFVFGQDGLGRVGVAGLFLVRGWGVWRGVG